MATITDVAELAQVSVATVSRALRGLPNVAPATRERVLRAADELHYVVDPAASRLAAGRTSTVGLVMPKLGQWYYAHVFTGVEGVLADAGVDVLPFPLTSRDRRERFLERLPFRKRVDGLIVVDVPMTDDQLDRLASADVAVVTVGRRSEHFSSLTVDNVHGARMATEHLVALGHERIGLLGGGDDFEAFRFSIPRDRRAGYVEAHRARDLAIDDDLLIDAEVTMSGGASAMQQLLHRDTPPTAVFALSDEMAIGALQVASSLGMTVPDRLSIVGFDDHEVAEYVGLTTVRQDAVGQGATAASWMLELAAGSDRIRHEVERPRLVTRSSSGRAPSDRDLRRGGR